MKRKPRSNVEECSFPSEIPGPETLSTLGRGLKSCRLAQSPLEQTSLTSQCGLWANAKEMTLYTELWNQLQTSQNRAYLELELPFGACSRRGDWGLQGHSVTIDEALPSTPWGGRSRHLYKSARCFLSHILWYRDLITEYGFSQSQEMLLMFP